MDQKKLTTENNHICGTFWTDAAVAENLIFFFFLALSPKNVFKVKEEIQIIYLLISYKYIDKMKYSTDIIISKNVDKSRYSDHS